MHQSRTLSVVGLLALSAGVACAQSGPQGAQVVQGNVSIERAGAETVIRASNRAIINYRSFDVASGELVRFVQPAPDARVLNRITGGAPTRIDGSVQANGRVYFVNRAGIAFGPGSVVDAGRFYAIAGAITDRDFTRGLDRFTLTGSLTNEGAISARDGVVLAGQTVTNAGTITSVDASAVMVAGGQVLVREGDGRTFVSVGDVKTAKPAGRRVSLGGGDMLGSRLFAAEQTTQLSSAAVTSTGMIQARQVHLESTGATSVAGAIDTSALSGAGGDVRVLGERVHLAGDIDARGATSGGTVLVGGDWQGKGDLRTATITTVSADATINTSGVGTGSAGTAVVWADDHTSFAGTMLAQGGEAGGDGAWIEVSGKNTLDYRGFVNASAAKGQSGTLLLDPKDITINNGQSGTLSGVAFGDNASSFTSFDADAITSITNTGTNVILQANNDITVNIDSIITNNPSGTGGNITLQAGRSVIINNASIVTDGGNLSIFANDSAAQSANRDSGAGGINFNTGDINAGTGNVLLSVGNSTGVFTPGNIRFRNMTANRLTIQGTGTVTQVGPMNVSELLVQNTGNVTLTNASNSIATIAGDIIGSLNVVGTGATTIDEIASVNVLRSSSNMTLDFGTILQNKPIDAPSLTATARVGGILLPNISNTVASVNLRSVAGQTSDVGSGGLTFTNNGNLNIAGLSTTVTATILAQGEMSQTGPISVDTLWLTSYSNGTPTHTLTNAGNIFRELTFEGRNGVGNQVGVANLHIAEANGLVINSINTAGLVRVSSGGDVTQGAGTAIIASGFAYDSAAGSLTLTSPTNNFFSFAAQGTNINVFSSNSLNVADVLSLSGVSATGFARLISSQSIVQSHPITADHLIARTLTDGAAEINLAVAGNDVNQLTLETLTAAGSAPASASIRFRDDDGFSILRLRTAASARLGSNGVVNQTGANEGVRVGASLTLLGDGQWSLTDTRNRVPTLAGEGLSINLQNTGATVLGAGLDGASGVATNGTNNFLRIVTTGSISQTDRVQGDQLVLRVVSDTDSFINLDASNNNFARLTLEARTGAGAPGPTPITYRDADGFSLVRITTGSTAWFHAGAAVTQSGANAPVASGALLLTGTGAWTLDRADNAFATFAAGVTGNVNITNNRDLVIGSLNGTNGVSVGAGNFFRVVNAGNISQTHAMTGDLLVVRTLSDDFTQALVNHPGNSFTSVILQSNNRANNALGAGRLAYRDADNYTILGAQTNEQLLLHAESPVNQLGAPQPIIANGGLRLFGPGGYIFTRPDNRFPVIAGSTGTVFVATATNLQVGQLGATSGLTTSSNATLTSYGAISQTRPLVVGATLTATTRASGTGSITLPDLSNRAVTTNFQVFAGSTSTAAAGNVDWGSSASYTVGQVRTLGMFTARGSSAVIQNSSGIGSASVRVLGTGTFDFSNAANTFTSAAGSSGTVNLRTSGPLSISQLDSTDGLVSTGNVTLTAGGAISQSRQLRGVSLLATTRNDAGANITLTGPNNFFSGTRTLRTRNANDTADVAASANYVQ